MPSEKETLQAIANRWRRIMTDHERALRQASEAWQAVNRVIKANEEGLESMDDDSHVGRQEVPVEGPSGMELVKGAIREYAKEEFKGADLSAIIRKAGSWKKRTPLANMVFMNLQRLVKAGEIEALDEGVYRVKLTPGVKEEQPSQPTQLKSLT